MTVGAAVVVVVVVVVQTTHDACAAAVTAPACVNLQTTFVLEFRLPVVLSAGTVADVYVAVVPVYRGAKLAA